MYQLPFPSMYGYERKSVVLALAGHLFADVRSRVGDNDAAMQESLRLAREMVSGAETSQLYADIAALTEQCEKVRKEADKLLAEKHKAESALWKLQSECESIAQNVSQEAYASLYDVKLTKAGSDHVRGKLWQTIAKSLEAKFKECFPKPDPT